MRCYALPVSFLPKSSCTASAIGVGYLISDGRRWKLYLQAPGRALRATSPGWDLPATLEAYAEHIQSYAAERLEGGAGPERLQALAVSWSWRTVRLEEELETLEARSLDQAAQELLGELQDPPLEVNQSQPG